MRKLLLLCICVVYMSASEYRYKEIEKDSVVYDNSTTGLIACTSKSKPCKKTLVSKVLKNGDRVVSTVEYYGACMGKGCPVEREFKIYDSSEKLKISKEFGNKRVLGIEEIDGGYRLYLDDDRLNRYIDYTVHYYQIDIDKDMKQIKVKIDNSRDKFFNSFIYGTYEEFVKNFIKIDYKKELYLHHNLIYYIVQCFDVKKIKFLEKHSYLIDKEELNRALDSSMQSKESRYYIEVLNYLETKGLNILTGRFLSHLIETNQRSIVEYMVEKRGMKINSYALIHSVVEKNRDMFDYLIGIGAGIDLNCSAEILQKEINQKARSVSSMILRPKYEMDYYLKDIDLFNASLYIKKIDGKYEVFVRDNNNKKEHKYSFSKNTSKIIREGVYRSSVLYRMIKK